MKVRNAVNPAIVLSFGTPAFAQDYSKVEIPVNSPTCGSARRTAISAVCPAGSTAAAQGNLFTYNTGLVFKYRTEHFAPFVEALGGRAHSNVYRNLLKARQASRVTSASPSNNAFGFIIGGGFDIPLTKSIAIRPAQFDLC